MMLPKKAQERIKDHIRAHEMYMIDLIEDNPMFGQRINMLKQFPLLMMLPQKAPPDFSGMGQPQPEGGGGATAQEPPTTPGPDPSQLAQLQSQEQPTQEQVPQAISPGGPGLT